MSAAPVRWAAWASRRCQVGDPDGAQGVEARLAVWFSFADPGDGQLVTEDDPVLSGLSDELRNRLAGTARPAPD